RVPTAPLDQVAAHVAAERDRPPEPPRTERQEVAGESGECPRLRLPAAGDAGRIDRAGAFARHGSVEVDVDEERGKAADGCRQCESPSARGVERAEAEH